MVWRDPSKSSQGSRHLNLPGQGLTPAEVGALRADLEHGGLRWLHFTGALESRYHEHAFWSRLAQNRWYSALGLVVLLSFGIADWLVVPQVLDRVLPARLVMSGLMVVALVLGFIPRLARHFPLIMGGMTLVIHAGLLYIGELAAGIGMFHYQAGTLLPVVFLCMVLRVRFAQVWPVVLMLWLLQVTGVGWLMSLPPQQITDLIFLHTFLSFIALVSSYRMEYEHRLTFAQQWLLESDKRALETARQELETLSTTDGLTQVANRRLFNQRLELEWARCQRDGAPLSVVMVDVDHFKRYNDAYGHQQGDRCLIDVAQVLRQTARRPADLVARYGGEEFALILPDTGDLASLRLAESMVTGMRRLERPHRDAPPWYRVTVSVGVATVVPLPELKPELLLRAADDALYAAKHEGRNQVRSKLLESSSAAG